MNKIFAICILFFGIEGAYCQQLDISKLKTSCEIILDCIQSTTDTITESQMEECLLAGLDIISDSIKEKEWFYGEFKDVCLEQIEHELKSKHILTNEEIARPKKAKFAKEDCFAVFDWMPVKMNVLYELVDNPLSISMVNVIKDSVRFKISQGELDTLNYNRYILKDLTEGEFKLTFEDYYGNLIMSSTGRVKKIPSPVFYITEPDSWILDKASLLKSKGLSGVIQDFDFYVVPRVREYTLDIRRGAKSIGTSYESNAMFSEELTSLLNEVQKGDVLLMSNIIFDLIWYPNEERERFLKQSVVKEIIFLIE